MASGIYCDLPRAAALPPVEADLREAARLLGVLPDDPAAQELLQAAGRVVAPAALPRMAWARADVAALEEQGFLQGEDIHRHLRGCETAVLLAVTLGPGADKAVRRAGVGDVAALAAADAFASALAEAAANAAEAILKEEFSSRGLYLTGRYSPGYGDWPLDVQHPFGQLLQLGKTLGVAVGPEGLLLPRKSITALLGVSSQPVAGHRAGCGHCALRDNCAYRKRGQTCGEE